jgi:hypothetical protein
MIPFENGFVIKHIIEKFSINIKRKGYGGLYGISKN